MRFSPFLLALALSSTESLAANLNAIRDLQADPVASCTQLKTTYPNLILLPEDDGYDTETEVSWTSSAWLKPACVFLPENAEQLAYAVTKLAECGTQFAMRGGGHMPIADAANIDSHGVLISSTNLNTLNLSESRQVMSIAPGNRWADVYEYLNGTDLIVVGGRLGPVGVPGLLLGGGISFYSSNHGMASAGGKIRAYECVLANGTIVTATADNEHADLHWALQGGGNSFALVTRFDLQTFYDPTPYIAHASYGEGSEVRTAFLSAVVDFTADNDPDPFSSIIPVANWGPNYTEPSYSAMLFYNGSTIPSSGHFAAFVNTSSTSLPAPDGSSILSKTPLANFATAFLPAFRPGGQSHGLRQKFRVISARATHETIGIIHDTYFSVLNESGIANSVDGFLTGLAFNTITNRMIEASAGAPYHIPPEPAFWVEQSLTWSSSADDNAIDAFLEEAGTIIQQKLESINGTSSYLYLNDADKDQDVFENYGLENLRRLKEIRQQYDPERVFTDLMPGGFKVDS